MSIQDQVAVFQWLAYIKYGGLSLARWVTLQHYFGTTQLKGCRPLISTVVINKGFICLIIYILDHRARHLLVWNNTPPHIRPHHNRRIFPISQKNLPFIENLFDVRNVASNIPSVLSSCKSPTKPNYYFTYPRVLHSTNSTFCPHSIFMCFIWNWEQTAIINP
jgi:hypothetical protein